MSSYASVQLILFQIFFVRHYSPCHLYVHLENCIVQPFTLVLVRAVLKMHRAYPFPSRRRRRLRILPRANRMMSHPIPNRHDSTIRLIRNVAVCDPLNAWSHSPKLFFSMLVLSQCAQATHRQVPHRSSHFFVKRTDFYSYLKYLFRL